ncbi:hypothetical protein [uncultured Mediterranean phage uvDeep-CGR2-AD7-C12]|jgi:hypothetical protein|nr:hypothetical protein [uncultured Mediterranean phage uvDeep-CGR2-AD7-C12]|tara:strand:- start:56 stop:304 length:249 start_codon:yes stop_codon:yes gene_type:complete
MSITKETFHDRIEVLDTGHLQCRTATAYYDDGVEVSRTVHRHVLEPGDSLEGEDPKVVAVAEAVWTDAVMAEWVTIRAARNT